MCDMGTCIYVDEDGPFCYAPAWWVVHVSCETCGDRWGDYPSCSEHHYEIAEILSDDHQGHPVTWDFTPYGVPEVG